MLSLILIAGCFLVPAEVLESMSVLIIGIEEDFWRKGWAENLRIVAAIGFYIIAIALILLVVKSKSAPKRDSDVSKLELGTWLALSFIFIGVTLIFGFTTGISNNPFFLWLTIGYVCGIGLYPLLAWKIFHLEPEDIGLSKRNLGLGLLIGGGLGIGYGFVSSLWHCCQVETIDEALNTTLQLAILGCLTLFCVYGGRLLGTKLNQYEAFLISALIFGFVYPWHTLWFAFGYALFGFFLCLLYQRTGTYATVYVAYFLGFFTHAVVPWRGFSVTWYIIIPLGILFAVFLTFYLVKYKNA